MPKDGTCKLVLGVVEDVWWTRYRDIILTSLKMKIQMAVVYFKSSEILHVDKRQSLRLNSILSPWQCTSSLCKILTTTILKILGHFSYSPELSPRNFAVYPLEDERNFWGLETMNMLQFLAKYSKFGLRMSFEEWRQTGSTILYFLFSPSFSHQKE